MGKANRNREIRKLAAKFDIPGLSVKSIARRLRKSANTHKYDSHGGRRS